MESDNYLYQKEWDENKFRQMIPFVGIFLWILTIIVYAIFNSYLKYVETNFGFDIFLVVFVIFAMLFAAGIFYLQLWKCPRCKKFYNYQSGVEIFIRKNFYKKLCVNCGLPRYYGSDYFLDYWGSEQAHKFEEVEKNK